MDGTVLNSRIDKLLKTDMEGRDAYANVVEAQAGTLTLLRTIYGDVSAQAQMVTAAAQKANAQKDGVIQYVYTEIVWPVIKGVLRALKDDVEAGVVGNIRRLGAGEVLGEMLALAKEALADGSANAKNVAAVLVAASYEDTIRKMGQSLAGVQGRPDLADVIGALKKADILQGASVATATGFLKFRNDALHADWSKLNSEVVGSCMSFVEHLLLRHFS